MKHALLLFGIVLALAGAYAIYSGYSIIEVERGWASVIAGATALTGGAILVALAWILRSLDRLSAALEAGEISRAGAIPPQELAEFADLPVAPATGRRPGPAEIAEPLPEPAVPPAIPVAAPRVPQPAASAAEIPSLSRASSAFVTAAAKATNATRTEPSISDLWRRVGVNLEGAKSAKPERGAPASQPPRSAAPNGDEEPADWLDQALDKYDAAIAPDSLGTGEDMSPFAPTSPPAEVVGRYEAEGTAYVMYADGSIEAQTQEGVLRFRSMAELKAFFHS
jgi:hypothetical protein